MLNDWPRVRLDPSDEELYRTPQMMLAGLADISLPGRLPTLLMREGFVNVSVAIEADPIDTSVGTMGAPHRRNLAIELDAARPHAARALGGETACDAFYKAWLAFLDRPDSSMVLPLWFVTGSVPNA